VNRHPLVKFQLSEGHRPAQDRKKVYIQARTTPVLEDITLYFRVFDVDDPSDSGPIIDTNDLTGPTGDDNYNDTADMSIKSAATNSQGMAGIVFTVSMSPGNNYRAVVHTRQAALQNLTSADIEDTGAWPIRSAVTETLTVWRKLHLEVDSMGPVSTIGDQKNQVDGTVEGVTYDNVTDETTIDLGQNLPDEMDQENLYAHQYSGRIVISETGTYDLITASSNNNPLFDDTIIVSGQVPTLATGKTYILYDDDSFLLPHYPDVSLAADKFHPAYILQESAGNQDNNLPFDRNITGMDGVLDSEKDLVSGYDYWLAYIYGAYQGLVDKDNDGFDENFTEGCCYNNAYAAIFLEVIYEDANPDHPSTVEKCQGTERIITVHEIGHQFGLDEDDSGPGLMNAYNRAWNEGDLGPKHEFTEKNIRDIRHRDYPGH
jgi:hypothetical protein